MNYDVIVIGGGPSGLMASVSAAEHGAKVLLVDKGNKLGRKLAISGGGRCNVTNRLPLDELIKFIPGNGKFLYSAFNIFDNEDIITFFEDLGIKLKEEDHGRMFPVTDDAKSVVNALLDKVRHLNVTIQVNTPVEKVLYEDGAVSGVRLKTKEDIHSSNVVIAVGGKSVPHTGSTGDGYAWAEEGGHTITDLYPTEVPLTSSEAFIKNKELQGLSLRDVALSVLNPKGKVIKTHRWDMIFTHIGLSGPSVLRCSQYVVKAMKKFNAQFIPLQIDAVPDQNEEQLFREHMKLAKEEPKKAIKNIWKSKVPERYMLFLFTKADISPDTTYAHLSKEKVREYVRLLKQFQVAIDGTLPIDKAFVTGGGVSLKEIHPKEMASKFTTGLYFCGEVLDIHGYTGGYNITSAFVTGYTAGKSAAERNKTSAI